MDDGFYNLIFCHKYVKVCMISSIYSMRPKRSRGRERSGDHWKRRTEREWPQAPIRDKQIFAVMDVERLAHFFGHQDVKDSSFSQYGIYGSIATVESCEISFSAGQYTIMFNGPGFSPQVFSLSEKDILRLQKEHIIQVTETPFQFPDGAEDRLATVLEHTLTEPALQPGEVLRYTNPQAEKGKGLFSLDDRHFMLVDMVKREYDGQEYNYISFTFTDVEPDDVFMQDAQGRDLPIGENSDARTGKMGTVHMISEHAFLQLLESSDTSAESIERIAPLDADPDWYVQKLQGGERVSGIGVIKALGIDNDEAPFRYLARFIMKGKASDFGRVRDPQMVIERYDDATSTFVIAVGDESGQITEQSQRFTMKMLDFLNYQGIQRVDGRGIQNLVLQKSDSSYLEGTLPVEPESFVPVVHRDLVDSSDPVSTIPISDVEESSVEPVIDEEDDLAGIDFDDMDNEAGDDEVYLEEGDKGFENTDETVVPGIAIPEPEVSTEDATFAEEGGDPFLFRDPVQASRPLEEQHRKPMTEFVGDDEPLIKGDPTIGPPMMIDDVPNLKANPDLAFWPDVSVVEPVRAPLPEPPSLAMPELSLPQDVVPVDPVREDDLTLPESSELPGARRLQFSPVEASISSKPSEPEKRRGWWPFGKKKRKIASGTTESNWIQAIREGKVLRADDLRNALRVQYAVSLGPDLRVQAIAQKPFTLFHYDIPAGKVEISIGGEVSTSADIQVDGVAVAYAIPLIEIWKAMELGNIRFPTR